MILKNKKRELTLIVITAIVLTLFFTGYSIGKGLSDTVIKTNAEVAKPILIVENGKDINISGKENKGIYDFKVKNYDSNEITTQVDLKYTVEIISDTDASIIFKLYKNNKEIILQSNKTQEMLLSKNKKQEDVYKLEIVYDKTKTDSISDIIENVQIKVHSEQLKV